MWRSKTPPADPTSPRTGLFGRKARTSKDNVGRKKSRVKPSSDSRNDGPVDRYTPIAEKKSFSFSEAERQERLETKTSQSDQLKIVYRQFGFNASEVIAVEQDNTIPQPQFHDHVVVKVQASTVSLNDCIVRRGFCFDLVNPVSLPVTPGHDLVGTIVARGAYAREFKEGERVAALVRTGGNARYVSVPQSSLVKVPKNVDCAEAAAMVTIYTTAYQALKSVSNHGPMFSLENKKVLIIGGMDGVGQALIQMCTKANAEIYTTGPDRIHKYLKNVLGVNPLPDDPAQWLPLVEGQMDLVFDGLCADGLESSHSALAETGELVCFGHASLLQEKEMGLLGAPMSAHVNKLWGQMKPRTQTLDLYKSFESDPETYVKNLKSLLQLLKWGKIRPHIAKRVAMSDVATAHAKLENGEVRGAVVLLPFKRVASRHIAHADDEREE